MVKKIFHNWHNKNFGLLLIRIGIGSIFLVHGIGKLSNMEATIGFFSSLGISSILAWFVALVETLVGLGMLFGVFTKIGGMLLAIIMLIAIIKVKFPRGGFSASEFEIILLLASLGISLIGPGKYSIGNHSCGCVGGKCVCKKDMSYSNPSVCKCGCQKGNCNCDNCIDQNCSCSNCVKK